MPCFKIVEIANAVEAVQDGRIPIEKKAMEVVAGHLAGAP